MRKAMCVMEDARDIDAMAHLIVLSRMSWSAGAGGGILEASIALRKDARRQVSRGELPHSWC